MPTTAARVGAENRYGGWLVTAGTWIVAGPFLLLGLLMFIGMPGALGAQLAKWTFEWGVVWVEIVVVGLLMAATVTALWWAFAHGGAISRLHLGRLEPTIRALAVTVFSVATFSSLTALLYVNGALKIRGGPIPRDIIIDKASEVFVWHLVDTVPLLDVTSNLAWKPAFEFDDRVGGLLIVAFQGVVILPVVQVARLIFAGRRATYSSAVMTAIRRTAIGTRIRESSTASRIVVEHEQRLVVVDVMSEIWTEDAPVRRIRQLADRNRTTAFGYLLTVDAIADRARDRVEQELGRAPFPGRLLVWRSDEPRALVREELERLFDELATREDSATAE